jgi:hypothetical protein
MAERLVWFDKCPFVDKSGGRNCINPNLRLDLYCRVQINEQIDPNSLHKVVVANNQLYELLGSNDAKTLDILVDDGRYATLNNGEITVINSALFQP